MKLRGLRNSLVRWLFAPLFEELENLRVEAECAKGRNENIVDLLGIFNTELNDLRNTLNVTSPAPQPSPRGRTARNWSEFRNAAEARPKERK